MDAMATPSTFAVKVDRQGRLVLPQELRRKLVDPPGQVILRKTPDGVLLQPVATDGEVHEAADGYPVLTLGQPVTNEQVLQTIHDERSER
jgi:bifunctional DNA-binding transcriptional regulator/antitoxin component of YhaV-PrlF toxin-antitoxin module